jgi:hypothetical protein
MIPANRHAEQKPTIEQAFPACHLNKAPEDSINPILRRLLPCHECAIVVA